MGHSRKENIKKSLELIKGDLGKLLTSKNILLKPNLTSAYNPGANTSVETVQTILEFFQRFDQHFYQKNFVIAETSGEAVNRGESMLKVYQRFGYLELIKKFPNLKIIDLEKINDFCRIKIKLLNGLGHVRVPNKVFDFDYLVSICLPKTHDLVIATLGIKNLIMGIVKSEDKILMHGREKASFTPMIARVGQMVRKVAPWQLLNFLNIYGPNKLRDAALGLSEKIFWQSRQCMDKNLSFLAKRLWPDLVVIDGWQGMEGEGPVYGQKIKSRWASASTDALRADYLGAKMMGINPREIGYLKLIAQNRGFSDSSAGLVGEKIESWVKPFKRYHRDLV